MSQESKITAEEMREEYDIRGGVRGKYYERYRQGTNVVLLDPDVAAVFRDSAAVNKTLRLLVSLARAKVGGQRPPGRRRSPNKPLQPTSRAVRGARRQRRARTARG